MQYVYGINSSFTVTSLLDLPILSDILEDGTTEASWN